MCFFVHHRHRHHIYDEWFFILFGAFSSNLSHTDFWLNGTVLYCTVLYYTECDDTRDVLQQQWNSVQSHARILCPPPLMIQWIDNNFSMYCYQHFTRSVAQICGCFGMQFLCSTKCNKICFANKHTKRRSCVGMSTSTLQLQLNEMTVDVRLWFWVKSIGRIGMCGNTIAVVVLSLCSIMVGIAIRYHFIYVISSLFIFFATLRFVSVQKKVVLSFIFDCCL